ncbi:MAG: hypothetical protein WAX04_03625 [Oscillospiraceae bacterium]
MATLEQRLTKLEVMSFKPSDIVTRIMCKGATPTPEEQAQIDEADKLGGFVIVRAIISP